MCKVEFNAMCLKRFLSVLVVSEKSPKTARDNEYADN